MLILTTVYLRHISSFCIRTIISSQSEPGGPPCLYLRFMGNLIHGPDVL